MSKRTPETQKKYDDAKKNGSTIIEIEKNGETFFNLNRAVIKKDFKYWVIIKNDFPYDSIFNTHDMLVPKRPFNYIREAEVDELAEYFEIKSVIDSENTYESIIENFTSARSAAGHFHSHVVIWKR